MKVQFFNFSKKNKSTKQPSAYAIELEVYWKEETSILNPTILCSTDISPYNYCYIPSWGRYYYYSNLDTIEKMWQVQLSEDYLASWKINITRTSCNIMYATGSSKSIVDTRIPVLSTISFDVAQGTSSDLIISPFVENVVIGVTGKGSFGSFIMQSPSQMSELLDGIDVSAWTDPIDFFKQAAYGGSASDCLRSAVALPISFTPSDVANGSGLVDLYLGNYPAMLSGNIPIKVYEVKKTTLEFNETVTIPWTATGWRRTSNYTSVGLFLPLFGLFEIPATQCQNQSTLYIKYILNVTSGDLVCEVKDSRQLLITASTNCAIPAAYGSTGINTAKMTTGVVAGIGAVAGIAGAVISGGISAAGVAAIGSAMAGSAGSIISAMGGYSSGNAGMGGGAAHGGTKDIYCYVTSKQLTDSQSNFDPIMGKPYMGVSTPGAFSGYVQTDGFQVEGSGMYQVEKDTINSLLDTGVYIE